MEEVVKLLALLPSTGSDCPYTLVWLNGDAHHMLLPKKGHLSAQVMGGTISTTCRRVSQLWACQLLSSGSQIVYVVGLNGCEVPMIMSPTEPIAKGVNLQQWQTILPKGGHPSVQHRGARGQSPTSGQSLSFYLNCKPYQASFAKGRRRGQHDHRGEGAPIPGRIRHIWACIRELHL